MFDRVEDTIVAISSPPGNSSRGIIRLSGPDALAFASRVFVASPTEKWSQLSGHRRLVGQVCLEPDIALPAEAYVFRAPSSYTRQDMVELHLIGSPPILAVLLDKLVQHGARTAEPGEFSARAFFSGAMDLTEVEGVAEMIHAQNDAQLRASQALLRGELSRRIGLMREQLTETLALLEAQMDFAEEPIEFISPEQLTTAIQQVRNELRALLENAPRTENLDLAPRVLLVGRPNGGKSTMFNRLTGMDRAIASATAGTTRDVLAAPLKIDGGQVMLLDSAGLEAVHEQQAGIQALAVRMTQDAIASADLILIVIDVSQSIDTEEHRALAGERPFIWVLNKIDAVARSRVDALGEQLSGNATAVVQVSARTGQGLDALLASIANSLFLQAFSSGSEMLALSSRQHSALEDGHEALNRALAICCEPSYNVHSPSELVAVELREALRAFSMLTGEVTTEDLLALVFERFCVGK